VLERLLALDGFDFLGHVTEAGWRSYVDGIARRLDVAPGQSIFDVGCGAGAFLYPFYEGGHPVAGLDYAASLLRAARIAMPGVQFTQGEAAALDPASRYDVVVASGVFLYFPDYAYAAETLRHMVAKASKAVAVLDVPDLALRDGTERERRRALGAEEYARRYHGLPHLYFEQAWFARALADLPHTVRVEQQRIAGYRHNDFRFNVFIALGGDGA